MIYNSIRTKLLVAIFISGLMIGFFFLSQNLAYRFVSHAISEQEKSNVQRFLSLAQQQKTTELISEFFIQGLPHQNINEFSKRASQMLAGRKVTLLTPYRSLWGKANDGGKIHDVAYIIEFSDSSKTLLHWLIYTGSLGTDKVTSVNLTTEEDARSMFGFFKGQVPVKSYFLLGLWIIAFGIYVWAAANCLVERPKRWPLWLLFILCGVGYVSFSWTVWEPSVAYQLLSFQLFVFNVEHSLFSPWVFTMSLPIGAIIFLWRFGFSRQQ